MLLQKAPQREFYERYILREVLQPVAGRVRRGIRSAKLMSGHFV